MIKNIVRGYGRLLSSILKILLLLILCVFCGGAIVFPLWKFASVSPAAYTYSVLAVIFFILVFFAVKKIKSSGPKKSIAAAAKFLVVAGGIFSVFVLVIYGRKILALPVLVLMIFLYGILSFKIKN